MKKNILKTLMLIVALQFSLVSIAGNAKLYIATNKESYMPAEQVQFEIFLLNATNTLSTVYVELLDCKGNNIVKKMLPLSANTSWGHVDLPEMANAEFYILYCYVLNNDTIQSHYVKKIFVNSNKQQLKTQGTEVLIEYFLEGGAFVADLPNNLLVRTKDENGNAVSTEVRIMDDSNTVITRFVTNQMGVAKLNINPALSGKYFIVANNKEGKEIKETLPLPAEYGVSLSVMVNTDSIKYRVFSYSENEKQADYKLEIISGNETVYSSAINFTPGISFVTKAIDSKLLPAGFLICRLTDKNNRFYTKRIIYNDGQSPGFSTLKIVDTVSNKTAKVDIPDYVNGVGYLNILFKDKNGEKTGTKNELAEEITFNDMLIADGELSFQNLSKKINNDSLLTLSGTAYSSGNKILQYRKINIVFLYKNLKKDYLVTTTDNNGKFEIKGLEFYDSVAVYYQLADKIR